MGYTINDLEMTIESITEEMELEEEQRLAVHIRNGVDYKVVMQSFFGTPRPSDKLIELLGFLLIQPKEYLHISLSHNVPPFFSKGY
jgi:hypothetical protein